jgi:hypothetical protein
MRGLIAFATLLAQAAPIAERLPPVEQCAAQAGFEDFRSRLKEVVARKDERALLAMLADDVEVNFGGDYGPALFATNWKFDEAGESHVWIELQEALSRGCAPSGDALVAPSFVAHFPQQLDAFETVMIVPGAQLRGAPIESAAGTRRLDWHLAQVTEDRDQQWLGVRLIDGRSGFVRRNQTVNPLDYRLVFEKRSGRWMITAFVAGD